MGNITKLPVNCFKWIQETFQFNKDFIKSFDEESDEIFFLLIFNIQESCMSFVSI